MTTAILLSGGMDSTALAYWLHPDVAVTVDYGQRPAAGELRAAAAVCEALGIQHHIISCDLSALGSGDLAGVDPLSVAPVTEWWPYRNQMLITLAAMKCIALGVAKILVGALKTDGLHADGRPEFFEKINALLGTQEGQLTIATPAIDYSAAELVRASGIPLHILAFSHSCHTAEYACGVCRGCRKHYETMLELGYDPY